MGAATNSFVNPVEREIKKTTFRALIR